MTKRLAAVFSVLLIAAMMLTACGGGGASQPAAEATAAATEAATVEATAEAATAEATEAATAEATVEATAEATAEAAAAAPAGGVVNITFLGAGPGAEAEFRKKQVAEWNAANPDIQVKFVEGPVSATDRFGLLLQAFQAQSTDIDVTQIDVIWPGDLAEHLVDFNQYGGAEAVADDFPAIVTNNTVDGAPGRSALVHGRWSALLPLRPAGEVRLQRPAQDLDRARRDGCQDPGRRTRRRQPGLLGLRVAGFAL